MNTVGSEGELQYSRLAANLSSAARVDLTWCDRAGTEVLRMTDIRPRRRGRRHLSAVHYVCKGVTIQHADCAFDIGGHARGRAVAWGICVPSHANHPRARGIGFVRQNL